MINQDNYWDVTVYNKINKIVEIDSVAQSAVMVQRILNRYKDDNSRVVKIKRHMFAGAQDTTVMTEAEIHERIRTQVIRNL